MFLKKDLIKCLSVAAIVAGAASADAANANHLVLSEIGLYPSDQTALSSAEFVEIYNPTSTPIELDNYYFTDSNVYSSIPRNPDHLVDTNTTDQVVRFPAGYVLQPGQVAVITGGAQNLLSIFYSGDYATYQADTGGALLFEVGDTRPDVPQMISLNTNETDALNFSLTNPGSGGGEFGILFYWDNVSETVRDVDMVTWGGPTSGQNFFSPKKGFGYITDTGSHSTMSTGPSGDTLVRVSIDEPSEVTTGGNGITGHDESTETPGSWLAQAGRDANMTPGTTTLTETTENQPPIITGLTRDKKYPAVTDTVTLSAGVTDPGDTVSVEFMVDLGDGAGYVSHPATNSGTTYSVTLPAITEPTLVKYYVTAVDAGSASNVAPVGGVDSPAAFWHGEPFAGDSVLINEIQFDIIGTDTTEWIELYNRNNEEVSLAGYRISDASGIYFTFPDDAVIAANGFVVLTYNETRLRSFYPDIPVSSPVYTYPFSQGNGTDTLTITSPNEYNVGALLPTPIDIVTYSKVTPWPTENGNETGQSIELKNPSLDNNDGSNWAAHPPVLVDGNPVNSGTPGAVNSTLSSVADWSVY